MPVAKTVNAGNRFGRLVVLREVNSVRTPNGTLVRCVECECDCGVVKEFRLCQLRNGHTKSCGCLKLDDCVKRFTTHGGSGTPEYRVWAALIQRCRNSNDSAYQNYGERGIRVCDRWGSFENFMADMGERPSPDHSIDRINNDGNYEPGNCRWATMAEQSRNTRVNVLITHDGETLCVAEWAERYGIPQERLNGRLKSGWDFEKAVSTPPRQGDDDAFLRTPIRDRDAAWYREYERRER
jgi:hypothetical protein